MSTTREHHSLEQEHGGGGADYQQADGLLKIRSAVGRLRGATGGLCLPNTTWTCGKENGEKIKMSLKQDVVFTDMLKFVQEIPLGLKAVVDVALCVWQ